MNPNRHFFFLKSHKLLDIGTDESLGYIPPPKSQILKFCLLMYIVNGVLWKPINIKCIKILAYLLKI